MAEHPNCQAIEKFLQQFKMPLRVGRTENIDNVKVDNGYVAAFHDSKTGIGFTAVCWGNGHFKAIAECGGTSSDAELFGKLIAKVIEPDGR